jgi:hypothetical protein
VISPARTCPQHHTLRTGADLASVHRRANATSVGARCADDCLITNSEETRDYLRAKTGIDLCSIRRRLVSGTSSHGSLQLIREHLLGLLDAVITESHEALPEFRRWGEAHVDVIEAIAFANDYLPASPVRPQLRRGLGVCAHHPFALQPDSMKLESVDTRACAQWRST